MIFDYCEGAHTRARIMNDLEPIFEIGLGVMDILGVTEDALALAAH
jgi:hypothetical protein